MSSHLQKVGIDYDIDNWARSDDDANFGVTNYLDQGGALPADAEFRMRQLIVKQNRLDQVRLEKHVERELVITSIRKADNLMGPLQSSFRKSLAEVTRYKYPGTFDLTKLKHIDSFDMENPRLSAIVIFARYKHAIALIERTHSHARATAQLKIDNLRAMGLAAEKMVIMTPQAVNSTVISVFNNVSYDAWTLYKTLWDRLNWERNNQNFMYSTAYMRSSGGICMAWNTLGKCPNEKSCGLKHICFYCSDANHQFSQCTSRDMAWPLDAQKMAANNLAFNKTSKFGYNPPPRPTQQRARSAPRRTSRAPRKRVYTRGYNRGGGYGYQQQRNYPPPNYDGYPRQQQQQAPPPRR